MAAEFCGEENFKLEDLLAFQTWLSSFTVGVEEAGVLVEKVTFKIFSFFFWDGEFLMSSMMVVNEGF